SASCAFVKLSTVRNTFSSTKGDCMMTFPNVFGYFHAVIKASVPASESPINVLVCPMCKLGRNSSIKETTSWARNLIYASFCSPEGWYFFGDQSGLHNECLQKWYFRFQNFREAHHLR